MKRALLALAPAFALALLGCGSSQKCPDPPPGATPSPAATPSPTATTSTGAPAPTTPNQPAPGVFHIEVGKDGALSIEGSAVSGPRELGERARASAKDRPDLLVIIAADKETPYAHVLNAFEIAKVSGFSRIILGEGRIPQAHNAPAQQSVPMLLAGDTWKCTVHHHVDDIQKKSAFIAIHVGPDGVAQTVDILEDPGSGLGEAARTCALNQTYRPAVDATGKPTVGVKKLRLFFQER